MALDLTLCLVPKQIQAIFSKATNNATYAELLPCIPSLLKEPQWFDYRDKDLDLIQLNKDVAELKTLYHFTDDHYFYDSSRASSTIDYLLNEHIRTTNSSTPPSLLWEGGTAFPLIKAGQGIPISLYDKAQLVEAFHLLVDLEFSNLLVHYNYEKMLDVGVYKVTRPENLAAFELAFYEIQDIFFLALSENLLVLKRID
jgi:hypothetical protein